jgi:hypothetical protein
MAQAAQIVQPAPEEFYRLLSPQQEAKLTAIGNQNHNSEFTGSLSQTSAAPLVGVRIGQPVK